MSDPSPTSVYLILRVSGSFHQLDESATSPDAPKIDTGIPQFVLESLSEPLLTLEAAEALAQKLMLKDKLTRWVFRSVSAGRIEQIAMFEKTNGEAAAPRLSFPSRAQFEAFLFNKDT